VLSFFASEIVDDHVAEELTAILQLEAKIKKSGSRAGYQALECLDFEIIGPINA